MAKKQVYLIGIGGIGLSALARYYLAQNWAVSGSDSVESLITQELRKDGINVKISPKKPGFGPKTALIIRSQAISEADQEIQAARVFSIPIFTYPEAIGQLTEKYRTIAIAGAHGKSTTTAMIAEIFLQARLDPTIIVGAKLKSLREKNFRIGKSRWLILEADEFGGAFWRYSPAAALITNIDKEHLDFYKNFSAVKKSFLRFIGNIKENGLLVLNKDDKNILSIKSNIEKIAGAKKIKIVWHSSAANPSLAAKIKNNLLVPGHHNLSNALGAYWLAKNLGLPEKNILAGLKKYQGAWRRFEYKGNLRLANSHSPSAVKIFDDYAHHPTEIKATLAGAKEKFPDSKIICVFQPHQIQRLKLLFNDFAKSFNDADALILLPSYQVIGRDQIDPLCNSKILAQTIKKRHPGKEIFYLSSPAGLKNFVLKKLNPRKSVSHPHESAIIIMMGAGNISDFTDSLLK